MTLKDKIKLYEDCYDFRIMPQVPIIVKANMRNYDRIIRNLDIPFPKEFNDIASNSLFASIKEIEGALFGYYFNGEYIFVLRNDLVQDSPVFYNNKVQTVSSVITSLLTNNFVKHFLAADEQPNVSGEVIFSAMTYPVPSIPEAINLLVLKQKECKRNAIDAILISELHKLHDGTNPKDFLDKKSYSEKNQLLDELTIDINQYPRSLLYGFGSYKAPRMLTINGEDMTKNKWVLDYSLPDLLNDKGFLINILKTGHDVFRP